MKRMTFFVVLFLCFTSVVLAGEPTLRDRVIGAAFKGLANTYLAAYDLEKGKQMAIRQLEAMSDEKFNKEYARTWPLIEGLPGGLKDKSGLSSTMTRAELISRIRLAQKDEFRNLINAVPDEAVSREFDAYVARTGEKLRQSDPVQQIQKTWQRVLEEIQKLEKKWS